jgi:outer membrane protein assembly factor BamB
MTHIESAATRKPLRLWPGVAAAVLLVILAFVVPAVAPDIGMFGFLGGFAMSAVILLWWLFFSRAPWAERLVALVAIVPAFFVVRPFIHESILGGAMGMLFPVLAVAFAVMPALVLWAVVSRRMSVGVRYVTLVLTFVLACGAWGLVRTDGMKGGGGAQFKWRWTPTAEEKLLAQGGDEPKAAPVAVPAAEPPKASAAADAAPPKPAASATATPAAAPGAGTSPAPTGSPAAPSEAARPIPARTFPRAEWPGFRGPERDGVVRGVRIATDWTASPPSQLWRHPIGPGWSSFAVAGDLFYTQEQRGEDEIVACYRLSTGEPVWRHRDRVRFWESNGGAGPRATPTLANGRVYAFGATGILNVLDAATGAAIWSHSAASDVTVKVPMWGFASSPLVVDGVVIVAVSGALAAYDQETGKLRWSRPSKGGSYSSPHLATIDGVAQAVLLSSFGAASVAPADGKVLWEYEWKEGGTTIVQPAVTAEGDILINAIASTGGIGLRRLAVTHDNGGWKVEERWTSRGLKPYFNDLVVHKGHAYGFDGSILSCIDLKDGERKWKGGRYGSGQVVLLDEQDLLLVLSEEGELALVKATPDRFEEVAKVKAIEGKTWNHPVVVHDVLLVRNGEEMAAFRLSPVTTSEPRPPQR